MKDQSPLEIKKRHLRKFSWYIIPVPWSYDDYLQGAVLTCSQQVAYYKFSIFCHLLSCLCTSLSSGIFLPFSLFFVGYYSLNMNVPPFLNLFCSVILIWLQSILRKQDKCFSPFSLILLYFWWTECYSVGAWPLPHIHLTCDLSKQKITPTWPCGNRTQYIPVFAVTCKKK